MPLIKHSHRFFWAAILLLAAQTQILPHARAGQGIKLYYIRYDIKSSGNRIVDTHLLMVPAQQEFRTENFTTHQARVTIPAVPGDSTEKRVTQARENALKQILEHKGLKSVSSTSSVFYSQTAGMDTVISHEGAFIPPIRVVEQGYDLEKQTFTAVFQVRFSPISFPDRWKWLGFKTRVKSIVQDIMSLF